MNVNMNGLVMVAALLTYVSLGSFVKGITIRYGLEMSRYASVTAMTIGDVWPTSLPRNLPASKLPPMGRREIVRFTMKRLLVIPILTSLGANVMLRCVEHG